MLMWSEMSKWIFWPNKHSRYHMYLQVPLSKAEVKSVIRTYKPNTWQEHWGMSETDRHLYNIQYTIYFLTIYKIGKHPTGKCQHCYQPETVEHLLVNCNEYNTQRDHLFQTLSKAEHNNFSLSGLLGKTAGNAYHSIIKFQSEIDVAERIEFLFVCLFVLFYFIFILYFI